MEKKLTDKEKMEAEELKKAMEMLKINPLLRYSTSQLKKEIRRRKGERK